MDLSHVAAIGGAVDVVSLREEGVDLSIAVRLDPLRHLVSLREEGVDLSPQEPDRVGHGLRSPSARREWI